MIASLSKLTNTMDFIPKFFSPLSNFFTSLYIPSSRLEAEKSEEFLLQKSGLVLNNSHSPLSEKDVGSDFVVSKIFNLNLDDNNYLRTLHIKNNEEAINPNNVQKNTLVMTHGFGTALGFFFKNYKDLSEIKGIDLYSIDWLGMGLSSRPDFVIDKNLSTEERVAKAEEFFVESLEQWRQKMGIEKMDLLGHSFGGYMSSVYALKYPERVNKLILESPMGLPETPENIESFLQTGTIPPKSSTQSSTVNEKADTRGSAILDRFRDASFTYRMLLKGSTLLWKHDYTPQGILRMLGRFGPNITKKYIGTFRTLNSEELLALSQYMYHISVQKGSGEYSMGILLKPFAFAYVPLINRINNLTMPTYFLYGDRDWMDVKAGIMACNSIRNYTQLNIISNAGHNMHLDNPTEFNRILIDIINQ
ncbi:putative cardiolipin-specific deacylase, mitochondrial [Smittium mucronatum]|uniref:Putative cardiolipin-specific deacylase, mitochondrial n=1 Tax=Smittium mucronatum TaxID=133383 RepID=A0A1R0GPM5_9FUNG|nr:putative cardiolipin-specific deacylase, mitochondrial [Smittium mucronatum]